MTGTGVTEKIQDGVLKAVETSQNWTLGALRSSASALDTLKPNTSLIPFARQAPSPAEAVDVAFRFLGKVLDAQHSFLSGVANIYAPSVAVATKATPAASASTAKKA